MPRRKLIVILGPTAVGKTDLSIELARHFHTEILSGDSMLVYRGFDIGAAKPSLEERRGVPHHLIDIREPWENYSVVDFQEEASRAAEEVSGRGKIPILAGGTGLYVKSLLEGYQFSEKAGDEAYRRRMEDLLRERGKEYLHGLLAETDPVAASRLHVNDTRRVIRALEVAASGRERISQRKFWKERGELVYDAYVAGLRRDRQNLYERINARVDTMVSAGLFDEVRGLLDRGITEDMQGMKGIGYREAVMFFKGELTHEEAVERIKRSTRRFAKRQMTWYRKMPYIHWYNADEMSEEKLLLAVEADVEGYFS